MAAMILGRSFPSMYFDPFSIATEVAAAAAMFNAVTLVVIGGGSVATLPFVLSLSDPEKRRQVQAEEVGGGDKEVVREYFNNIQQHQVPAMEEDLWRDRRSQQGANGHTDWAFQNCGECNADVDGRRAARRRYCGTEVLASDISVAMVAEAEKSGGLCWFNHMAEEDQY
ncbi:hypothetical protein RJ639_010983 [Escallonia herrerae]|uniref:Uncharacterized protein n=1 Tax=Escallonia herrerae TaxID=1293975 RepID=A0AA89APB2_9ASTE|nr:hypothetical protein RJ639_010983 [Escallonia herrerae]